MLANDPAVLEALFWDAPQAVRYRMAENLHGADEIRASARTAWRVRRRGPCFAR